MLPSVFFFIIGMFAPHLSVGDLLAGPVVGGAPVCAAVVPPRVPMVAYRMDDPMIDVDVDDIEDATMMFAGYKLKANAFECDKRVLRGQFEGLHQQMLDQEVYLERHTFRAYGDYGHPSIYSIYAMPNFAGYADLKAVKKEFENCNEAPEFQPIRVTPSTILFERPCTPSEKEKRENGCSRAKSALQDLTIR